MAGSSQSASEEDLTCEKCHGFVAVEAGGGKPRVRCAACGHTKELDAPDAKASPQPGGKWTVIGPDGKVLTFGSFEELVASQRAAAASATAAAPVAQTADAQADAKKPSPQPSGASLLDVTPTPVAGKLTLADESSPALGADLVAKAKAEVEEARQAARDLVPNPELIKKISTPPKADDKKTDDKKVEAKKADEAEEKAPDSIAELDPESLVEDGTNADDEEPAPLSLRDAVEVAAAEEEPAPLSLRDAIVEDANEDEGHETLSLKDLVVVPGSSDAVDSTPPPPARGALKTLPPPDPDAAPPPTITVEDPASKDEASESASDKDAKKADAGKGKGKSSKSRDGSSKAKDGAKAKPISARAAVAEEEPKRGWVLPALAVAAGVVVVWRIMAAPQAPEPQVPTTTTTATATATATATTEPAPTASSEEPNASVSSSPPETTASPAPSETATPTAVTSATTSPSSAAPEKKVAHAVTAAASDVPAPVEKKAPAASGDGMSMSDLLDRAGSARRAGDYATARDLYERVVRQNPNNVEANGGLGDVARAQGDLARAKASYERALAASPSYGPAQLGLADTEWDLGNRAGAQRRYAQIVERLGDRAPERAKQRGVVTE